MMVADSNDHNCVWWTYFLQFFTFKLCRCDPPSAAIPAFVISTQFSNSIDYNNKMLLNMKRDVPTYAKFGADLESFQ